MFHVLHLGLNDENVSIFYTAARHFSQFHFYTVGFDFPQTLRSRIHSMTLLV